MDPRKGATVTAPDLLKAFAEGRGVEVDEQGSDTDLKVWMAYGDSENLEYETFPLTVEGMTEALRLAKDYLDREGRVLVMIVSKDDPREAISAADD